MILEQRFGAWDDVASGFKRTAYGHREVVAPLFFFGVRIEPWMIV